MTVEHSIQLLLQTLPDFFVEIVLAVQMIEHQINKQIIGICTLFTRFFPSRDGCDDCDGIFDTAPAVILIVTTVTNRHTAFLAKLMELPLRVCFMAYSMLYSFRNSPAFTLSLRVRMFGCISS